MEILEEQPISQECNSIENNSNSLVGTNGEGSSLGKFKNSDELLKAYNNLEKEFTKKCQKIKELEAFNDNESKSPVKADNDMASPENASSVSNDKQESKSIKEILLQTLSSTKNEDANKANKKERVSDDFNNEKSDKLIEEELKNFIYSNVEIRNKFIENYLNEIQSQKTAPLMVNSTNSNFCIMPKKKPQSISDAGEYAKEILKN